MTKYLTLEKFLFAFFVISSVCLLCGCSTDGEPHLRIGSYATATLGTNFLDSNDLGRHSYSGNLSEKDGIVYTCRGGHIDLAHVRITADYVEYTYNRAKKTLLRNGSGFSFRLNTDRSILTAEFKYPDEWQDTPREDREEIADEIALELSQYCSYTMATWHEILTWYGYKSMGVFPEFPSAFSWEDNYSNLVGTRLGAKAVKDPNHTFDAAMDIIIRQELNTLGVQPYKVARQASEKMKGKWWEGTPFVLFVEMKERNMDVGYVDGFVTPTLVPGICPDPIPVSYPVPNLRVLAKYGFGLDLEIEPREFEKDKIFKLIHSPDGIHINAKTDLPIIMSHVQNEAIHLGYDTMPQNKSFKTVQAK